MTEYQWKVLKRAIRERFDQPDHLMNLAAGRNAIRDVVEQSVKKPSRKRRVRAARYLGTKSELAERSIADGTNIRHDTTDDYTDFGHPAEQDVEDPLQPQANEPSTQIDPDALDVDDWVTTCE